MAVDPLTSVESLTLALPPSCIEFCPAHPDYFVVGTYNLEKDNERAEGDSSRPQHRNGSLLVFRLDDRNMHCLQTIPQPSAILDLHFQQTAGNRDVVAVASSTATLSIFRLSPSRNSTELLEKVAVVRIPGVGEEVLFLSCSWHPTKPDVVAVSTSTGGIYVINVGQFTSPIIISGSPVILHDLEAWTVVFSPPVQESNKPCTEDTEGGTCSQNGIPRGQEEHHDGTFTIYSGGDDSTLRYTTYVLNDPTAPNGALPSPPSPDMCKLKGHGAGVTAILPLQLKTADNGQVVITGSYDDFIRVYSIHSSLGSDGVCLARCLAQKNLGGGVWRLRFIQETGPSNHEQWRVTLLASCMHAGARIVNIEGDANSAVQISVAARFEEHESMNYGSDFQPGSSLLCVSTSFYDRRMCLWDASLT